MLQRSGYRPNNNRPGVQPIPTNMSGRKHAGIPRWQMRLRSLVSRAVDSARSLTSRTRPNKPYKLPDDPIFARLLQSPHHQGQRSDIIIRDVHGFEKSYGHLLSDILRTAERLRKGLPPAAFCKRGLLGQDLPYVGVLVNSGYEFIVVFFAIRSLGGACMPLCKPFTLARRWTAETYVEQPPVSSQKKLTISSPNPKPSVSLPAMAATTQPPRHAPSPTPTADPTSPGTPSPTTPSPRAASTLKSTRPCPLTLEAQVSSSSHPAPPASLRASSSPEASSASPSSPELPPPDRYR